MAKEVLPLPENARKESKRRPPKKVPSYHLTGPASMQYIKDADTRAKAKLAKKEPVKETKQAVKKTKIT